MNNKPKVSIVVPIYNKEQILHKCLDSLVNQTMQDIEIILINDGSTDNSEAVCLDYVEKYPNLVHYHAFENGGVSRARNRGIDLAVGEYIGFVDSDDWVSLDFYEQMYCSILKNYSKFVVSPIELLNMVNSSCERINITENYISVDTLMLLHPIVRNSVCNKLFSLDIVRNNKIKFPELSHMGEDLTFVFVYANCTIDKRISVSKSIYFYNINVNSATNSSYNKNIMTELEANIDEVNNIILLNTKRDELFGNIFVYHLLMQHGNNELLKLLKGLQPIFSIKTFQLKILIKYWSYLNLKLGIKLIIKEVIFYIKCFKVLISRVL